MINDETTHSFTYQLTTSECPSMNRAPLLIDWINTINEPNCLLLSSIDDLRDGRVLIEIAKHLLKQRGFYNAVNRLGNIEMNTSKDRFDMLFRIINKIDSKKDISLFKANVNVLGRMDEMLLDLVAVLKGFGKNDIRRIRDSEMNEVYHQTNSTRNSKDVKRLISIEDNHSVDHSSRKEANTEDNISKDEIQNYELTEKGGLTIETEERDHEKNVHDNIKITRSSNFSYFSKRKKIESDRAINKERISLSFIPMKYPSNKPITPKEIMKPSKLASFSISPLKNTIVDVRKSNKKPRLTCQRDLTSIIGLSSLSKVKIDSIYLSYYKLQKPTELIIESNSNQLIKRSTFNQKPKDNFHEKDFFIIVNNAKHSEYILPKKIAKRPQKERREFNYPTRSANISVDHTKQRIYLWLIDIGMIKHNAIDIYDVPSLCFNGIFLCDLINKCEGRFETLHGINRAIKKESQLRANIRKVLEHLRTKEAFPSRHLWAGDQIRNGEGQTIWELLEDIWLFYTSKVQKEKSLRNIFNKKALSPKGSLSRENIKEESRLVRDKPLCFDYHQELMKESCLSPVALKQNRSETPTIQIFNHFSYNNHNHNNTFTARACNESKGNNKRNNYTSNPFFHYQNNNKPKKNYILFDKLSLNGIKKEIIA